MSQSKYPKLWHIMLCYFHEDFDLFGNTIEELMTHHKSCSNKEEIAFDIKDIERFEADHSTSIDAAFEQEFGNRFNPQLWGHTGTSFLAELKRLLKEP